MATVVKSVTDEVVFVNDVENTMTSWNDTEMISLLLIKLIVFQVI